MIGKLIKWLSSKDDPIVIVLGCLLLVYVAVMWWVGVNVPMFLAAMLGGCLVTILFGETS